MNKQIIVSIDPLNIQHEVVAYAEAIARASGFKLLLYSVQGVPLLVDPSGEFTPQADTLPGHVKEVEEAAIQFYEQVKLRYPNTAMEHGVGFTATSVVNKVRELNATPTGPCRSLLVMAHTHGHSWWNNVFGTVEISVAAEAPCPVLLLPENAVFNGISRIMYLADMQSVESHAYPGFNFLSALADTFGAQLAVGFMCDPLRLVKTEISLGEAMDELKAGLPFHVSQEYQFFPEFSAEKILQIAEITLTDIVAFPFRKSTLFDRLIENEITRTLVLKATTPVLVF